MIETSTKVLRGECAWRIPGQARSVWPELKKQGRGQQDRLGDRSRGPRTHGKDYEKPMGIFLRRGKT